MGVRPANTDSQSPFVGLRKNPEAGADREKVKIMNEQQEIQVKAKNALEKLGAIPTQLGMPGKSDSGIADWAADNFLRNRITFNSSIGWYYFDGKVWCPTDFVVVREIVSEMLKTLAQEIKAGGGLPHAIDYLDRLQSKAKLSAVTDLLSGRLYRDADWFDRYPELFNANNGVVNLRTGEVLPHSADFGFTLIARGNFWPNYSHSDWSNALLALDEDAVCYLRDRVGQGLTGRTPPDEKIIFFRGEGQNGKSTIVEGLQAALGTFTVDAQEKLLLSSPSDHPVEKMVLRGRRIVFVEELPDGHHLSVKRLKDLTRPTMTARDIAKSNVTWKTSHSVFITTNYDSLIDEVDHATWRRLVRIPFEKTFTPKPMGDGPDQLKAIPGLKERVISGLEGQHDAIVTWAVEGSIDYYARGEHFVSPPKSIKEATASWQVENDKLLEFFEDEVEFDPSYYIATADLLAAFNLRMRALGYRPWGAATFSQRVKQHPKLKKYIEKPGRVRVKVNESSLVRSLPPNPEYLFNPAKQMKCWEGIRFKNLNMY